MQDKSEIEYLRQTVKDLENHAESGRLGGNYPFGRGFYEKNLYKGKEQPAIIEDLPKFGGRTIDRWMAERAKDGKFTILDIGCGDGNALRTIEEKYPEAEGYGISIHKFEPLQIDSSHIATGDASYLGRYYNPDTFDFVYSYQTLRWIGRPLSNILPKIYRLLKPNGKAFLHTADIWPFDKVDKVNQLDVWLKKRGYNFEFVAIDGFQVTRCSFEKTPTGNGRLYLPLSYRIDPYGNPFLQFDPRKAEAFNKRLNPS